VQCPVCSAELNRVTYEDQRVFQCPECNGYLAAERKVGRMKRLRGRSTEALQAEAAQEQRGDSAALLRCPKCRARKMAKQKIAFASSAGGSFTVDTCRACSVVWFDGGELARLQLDYESRPKARDELDSEKRSEARTAEEREKFEALLAVLPRHESFLERLMDEMKPILALAASLVAVVAAYWACPAWITVVASLACGAALAWLLLDIFGGAKRHVLWIAAAVLLIEVVWIAFLSGAFAS